jgi:hypothetical protein
MNNAALNIPDLKTNFKPILDTNKGRDMDSEEYNNNLNNKLNYNSVMSKQDSESSSEELPEPLKI